MYLFWIPVFFAIACEFQIPAKKYYTGTISYVFSVSAFFVVAIALWLGAVYLGKKACNIDVGGFILAVTVTPLYLVLSMPNIHIVRDAAVIAEAKQNLHSIQIGLERHVSDFNAFPLDIYILQPEGYMTGFPRNTWHLVKSKYGDLNERTRQLFAGDSMPFDGPGGRFGENGGEMANLCTGHEIGYDLIEWWNFQPAKKGEDAERKTTREMAAGHFVYLPLDENDAMIPYGAPDGVKVFDYVLILFGPPDEPGIDFFTPSGNPDAPVALTPDGIPDGVILVFEGVENK